MTGADEFTSDIYEGSHGTKVRVSSYRFNCDTYDGWKFFLEIEIYDEWKVVDLFSVTLGTALTSHWEERWGLYLAHPPKAYDLWVQSENKHLKYEIEARDALLREAALRAFSIKNAHESIAAFCERYGLNGCN